MNLSSNILEVDTFWLNELDNFGSIDAIRHNLLARYPKMQNLTKIAIVGAADEGKRLVDLCKQHQIEVVLLADDRELMQGKIYNNIKIKSTKLLSRITKDIPVIIASHRCLKPIQKLRLLGFQTVVPFALLQILYPSKFPPHMFYNSWIETLFNAKNDLKQLVDLLADEKSIETLDAIIGFRLTLDPEVLSPIIDWEVYAPKDLIEFGKNEIYIDGGTFDGDSIRTFIERTNNQYKKIYGFEPDTGTFKKLKQNFAEEARVVPINKGLYSEDTTLYFDNAGTRASILTYNSENNVAVPVTTIDKVLQGQLATFIKMNIEGAEIPALNGAKQTIQQYQPKLAISIYHKPNDLWEIPFLINQLNPNYSLYLRQQDGGVIEGVVYALPR